MSLRYSSLMSGKNSKKISHLGGFLRFLIHFLAFSPTPLYGIFLILPSVMRTTKSFFLYLLFILSFAACRHSHTDKASDYATKVKLNIDSLFIDLGEKQLAQRAFSADSTFRRAGLNGVVLFAEQGRIIYEKAFGWRNLSRQRDSLHIEDAFQLSSDSKMFTAEAIMLLQHRGLIGYNDDVTKYIPEFPYRGITIRNLLHHRSGLSRYEYLADEFWTDKSVPFTNDDMIRLYAEHKPEPYFDPDTIFYYNNVNYALLASVVERVTGTHFEDFIRDNIFAPLHMDSSFIYSMRGDRKVSIYMKCAVQGHDMRRCGASKAQNDYLNGVMGDKIMFSNVKDLYRFCMALDYSLLLPDSIQSEAFKPGSKKWRRQQNYGFGWRLHEKHPETVYHFGWWKGYRSMIIRQLKYDRLLIVLTNTDRDCCRSQIWDLVDDNIHVLPSSSLNIGLWKHEHQIDLPAQP